MVEANVGLIEGSGDRAVMIFEADRQLVLGSTHRQKSDSSMTTWQPITSVQNHLVLRISATVNDR